ncbi:MAG: ATP-dependent acyl-CoA ligase, partial [Candidatus Methanolliviera hydrocarbonicum]
DTAHTDENGWLFFNYREGGGLRRAGEFIQPEYVEGVIAAHPDVSEVGVYGVPAASGAPGESDVVAAVVPFEGKKIDPPSIFELCAKELPKNLIPSYVQVLDEIPKTISQKILDRVLRGEFNPEEKNIFKVENYLKGGKK